MALETKWVPRNLRGQSVWGSVRPVRYRVPDIQSWDTPIFFELWDKDCNGFSAPGVNHEKGSAKFFTLWDKDRNGLQILAAEMKLAIQPGSLCPPSRAVPTSAVRALCLGTVL